MWEMWAFQNGIHYYSSPDHKWSGNILPAFWISFISICGHIISRIQNGILLKMSQAIIFVLFISFCIYKYSKWQKFLFNRTKEEEKIRRRLSLLWRFYINRKTNWTYPNLSKNTEILMQVTINWCELWFQLFFICYWTIQMF